MNIHWRDGQIPKSDDGSENGQDRRKGFHRSVLIFITVPQILNCEPRNQARDFEYFWNDDFRGSLTSNGLHKGRGTGWRADGRER